MHSRARHYAILAAAVQLLALSCQLLSPTMAFAVRHVADDAIVLQGDLFWSFIAYSMIALGAIGLLAIATVPPDTDASDGSLEEADWVSESFDRLIAEDPHFGEDAFHDRMRYMFSTVHKAWSERNLKSARSLLSEQQYRNLVSRAARNTQRGRIDRIERVSVDHIAPVCVWRKKHHYYAKLMINAHAMRCAIDERTGELINPQVYGDGVTATPFHEFWIVRRKVLSRVQRSHRVRKCPNCGAPLGGEDFLVCHYCGTWTNPKEAGWFVHSMQPPPGSPQPLDSHPVGVASATSTTRSA